ncbi:receptor-type tyrosine-protein phosphatase kappa-like [Ctenocephalides felis]|uniref:receptor-type tyrosine-protein phosphatase kappa-like n=1 Tax=Ctenocephalides felis TaxID=7515 RepID=UPI000E6E4EBC|nr:receptor-type tyrosine-protein phosphatase kappa-like [Ctenocephalides felis]
MEAGPNRHLRWDSRRRSRMFWSAIGRSLQNMETTRTMVTSCTLEVEKETDDKTRVKLNPLPKDSCSDCINASYINGFERPREYIATQGPKENTAYDFWRMILQEKVSVICMLTQFQEKNLEKCFQYWPEIDKTSKRYGKITITNVEIMKSCGDYVVRKLLISSGDERSSVVHLHYTAWPEYETTRYADSLVPLLAEFQKVSSQNGPKVVHCSADDGRTGTITLADICVNMARATDKIDVLHYLNQIRKQRAKLVNSEDLYKLVHMTVLETLFGKKGRVVITRAILTNPDSDYINAVLVDGFKTKEQFIVTHFPLEQTIDDYWRMIFDKRVKIVIVFNEVDVTDPTVVKFVPTRINQEMKPSPRITIKTLNKGDSDFYTVYDVLVNNHNDGATACGLFAALVFVIEKMRIDDECDVPLALRTIRKYRKEFVRKEEQYEYLFEAALDYLDKPEDNIKYL